MIDVADMPCTRCGKPSRCVCMLRPPGKLLCTECYAISLNEYKSQRRADKLKRYFALKRNNEDK
jgi:hypothetical protein